MAFNLSPRGANFSKTGHGLPGGMIKSMPPLHQAKKKIDAAFREPLKKEPSIWDNIVDTVSDAASSVSDYFSGDTKPKTKAKPGKTYTNSSGEVVPAIPALESYNKVTAQQEANKAMKVRKSDKQGNFVIERGLGFTPKTLDFAETQLSEKVKAYKGNTQSVKNIQKSTDQDVKAAINTQVDYWSNPEVQKMYLNNNPEYKGDIKKAQQDINTHLALGANYEYVPHMGFSKQNKKQITVGSGAKANTFFPGYNQSWTDKKGVKHEGSIGDIALGNARDLRSERGIVAYVPYNKSNKNGQTREQLQGTLGHEFDHSSGFAERQGKALGKVLGSTYDQPGNVQGSNESEATSQGKQYLSRTDELYGNFKEYKNQLKLKPGEKVNRKKLQELEKKYTPSTPGSFQNIFDIDRKVEAINTVAQGGKKKSNLNFSGSSDNTGFKFTGNSNSSYA